MPSFLFLLFLLVLVVIYLFVGGNQAGVLHVLSFVPLELVVLLVVFLVELLEFHVGVLEVALLLQNVNAVNRAVVAIVIVACRIGLQSALVLAVGCLLRALRQQVHLLLVLVVRVEVVIIGPLVYDLQIRIWCDLICDDLVGCGLGIG